MERERPQTEVEKLLAEIQMEAAMKEELTPTETKYKPRYWVRKGEKN